MDPHTVRRGSDCDTISIYITKSSPQWVVSNIQVRIVRRAPSVDDISLRGSLIFMFLSRPRRQALACPVQFRMLL